MVCKNETTKVLVFLLFLVLFSVSISAQEQNYTPGTVSFFCIAQEISTDSLLTNVNIKNPTKRLGSGVYDILVKIESVDNQPIELADCPYIIRIRIDEFVVWELRTFQEIINSTIYVPNRLGAILHELTDDLTIFEDGQMVGHFEVLLDNAVIFDTELTLTI